MSRTHQPKRTSPSRTTDTQPTAEDSGIHSYQDRIRAMQSTHGNQAVMRMLEARGLKPAEPARPPETFSAFNQRITAQRAQHQPVIQRTLETPKNDQRDTLEEDAQAKLNSYVNRLNTAVEEGHTQVSTLAFMNWNMPSDGYVVLFQNRWNKLMAGELDTTRQGLLSANAGYAIESYATRFRVPDGNDGNLAWRSQVTEGSTRPDIVVYWKGAEIAWLDITASNSIGHIDRKTGSGWVDKPYVQEITYPSLNIAVMSAQTIPAADTDLDEAMRQYNERVADQATQDAKDKEMIRAIVQPIIDTTPTPRKNGGGERYDLVIEALRAESPKPLSPLEIACMLQFAGISLKTVGFKTYAKATPTARRGREIFTDKIKRLKEKKLRGSEKLSPKERARNMFEKKLRKSTSPAAKVMLRKKIAKKQVK